MAANKEHPLQRTWTLYFDGGGKAAPERPGEWKAMATVCTFNSVETFWRCAPFRPSALPSDRAWTGPRCREARSALRDAHPGCS